MAKKTTEQKQLPQILTQAGFIRLDKQPDGGYHAMSAPDFCNAHAAALKSLGNRVSCRRQDTVDGPILIVSAIADEPKPEVAADPEPEESAADE